MKSLKSPVFFIVFSLVIVMLIIMSFIFFDNNAEMNHIIHESPEDSDELHRLPGSDEKIYESISDNKTDSVSIYPSLGHDSVKLLLSSAVRPEKFYWEFNKTVISSQKERIIKGSVKFEGDNYRMELYSAANNDLEKTVIRQNDTITIQTYLDFQSSVATFSADTTSVFIEAGVPDITDFLSDEGKEFAYSLHESEYGKILYAEFSKEKDGYSQLKNYYISLDFGIVLKADCFENGNLIYSINTISLYEIENS